MNMSTSPRVQGVVVPMLTPLTASAEIDGEGVSRLVEFLHRGGVSALFTLGSSGEFCALTWPKQCTLLRHAVACARGRLPVYAGVSGNCLAEVQERCAAVAALGADAVVCVPPFYFRNTQEQLYAFLSAIADASPVPVILYNIPYRTNNPIENDTVVRLAAHGNIIGLKDTISDFARTLSLLHRLQPYPHFGYLHGSEYLALASALYGAAGCVPSLANFVPEFFSRAWNRAAAGDLAALLPLQAKIERLMRGFFLLERGSESTELRLMALKTILAVLGVIEPHMAQLCPASSPELLEPARRLIEEEGITETGGVAGW